MSGLKHAPAAAKKTDKPAPAKHKAIHKAAPGSTMPGGEAHKGNSFHK